VGTNPWTKIPHDRLENIAEICERYGGGGHARVGAISFNVNQHAQAIKASQEIVEELRSAIRAKKQPNNGNK
jgi:nanoRNase/pAp phosphatase (c-di-AMP/oligoRNAs hydrolase)